MIQGADGPARHVAEPCALPHELPGARRRPLRRRRCAARDRSSTSTAGRRSAAASSSTRRAPASYHTYLCDEVVPWVDERYRTLARPRPPRHRRASRRGGYGAMVTPMLRPDLFGGARHARRRRALRGLLPAGVPRDRARVCATSTTARYERFWEDFRSRPALLEGLRRRAAQRLVHGGLLLGRRGRDRAAAVRPRDRSELVPEVWERWLAWDPVRMVAKHADALRSLRRDLHRRRQAATSGSSTSAPRRSGARSRGSASPTSTSSSSTPRTWRSSTATRSGSGYLAERLSPLGRELVEAAVPVEAPELGIAADRPRRR